jgi:hypothetical protein
VQLDLLIIQKYHEGINGQSVAVEVLDKKADV